jgi:tetratricopeptide (TPR) repeat protein
MRSNLRRIAALASLTIVVAILAGCGPVNKLRAKNELNEGVRTFNRGKFEDAEKMFKHALEYDPDNVNAQFFYAMTVNARYEKSLNSQDVDKTGSITAGQETIAAFQKVLDMNPEMAVRDRAISFIAKAYKSLADQVFDPKSDKAKYDEARAKYLEHLEKRADLEGQTDEVKAQMYYTIGDDYWKEARGIIESYAKRDPQNPQVPATYEIPAEKLPAINAAITKAHEYMQKGIAKNPAYPEPYLGVKLIYFEEAKLAADAAKRDEIKKQADAWDEKYRDKLAEHQRAQAAAAEAAEAEAGK